MALRVLIGAMAAVTAMGVGAARAGGDGAGEPPPFPQVVYASPPAVFVLPPVGQVLDPSDSVGPIFVVNQGAYQPGIFGVVPLARPTYSEGGYAYAEPPGYDVPYIHSFGHGSLYGYRAWRGRPAYYGGVRPVVVAPAYWAYSYRAAPSARIIRIPPGE